MQLDSNGLYDIYPVWHVPFWQTTWFYGAVIIIAALIFFGGLFFIVKKWFKKSAAVLPPWQRALQVLQQLQQKKYRSEHDGKQCYFKLTDTIKTYLQERFDFPMQGKSDQEALIFLESQNMPVVHDALQEIVNGCLYVKFANQQALDEQIQRHIARAIEMINQTKSIVQK